MNGCVRVMFSLFCTLSQRSLPGLIALNERMGWTRTAFQRSESTSLSLTDKFSETLCASASLRFMEFGKRGDPSQVTYKPKFVAQARAELTAETRRRREEPEQGPKQPPITSNRHLRIRAPNSE